MASRGQLATSGDIFGRHDLGRSALGILWLETRAVAKHSTMHKTAAYSKNYPAPNVSSTGGEKHCFLLSNQNLYRFLLPPEKWKKEKGKEVNILNFPRPQEDTDYTEAS